MRKKLIIIISVLLLFSVILVFFPFKKKGVLWDANCLYEKTPNSKHYGFSKSCKGKKADWQKMEYGLELLKENYHIYEGEFTVSIFGNIELNGFGIWKDPIGRVYVGGNKNTQPHGYGTWKTELMKYEGEWKDGKRHGKGTETWSYMTKVGEWNGELHWTVGAEDGFVGTIFYSDGSKRVVEQKELIPQPYYPHYKDIPYWNSLTLTNLVRLFVNTFKKGKDLYSTRYDKDGNIIGKSINSVQLKKLENGEWQESVRYSGSRIRSTLWGGYDGQFYYFFP